ncbi:MAG: hypothetical protein J6Y96_00895 [Mycoplasma sp.]|nr:hypothetical protein [Mycoplasma sp.]
MSTDTKLIGKKVNVQIIKPKNIASVPVKKKKSTRELSVEFRDKQDESIKSIEDEVKNQTIELII